MVCVRQGLYFIVTGLHYKKGKKKDVGVVVRDVVVCVLLLLYVCVKENSLLRTHVQQQQHTRTTTTTHTTTTTRTSNPIWLIRVRQELNLASFFLFSFVYFVHVKNVIATGLHDPKKKLVRVCQGIYLVLTERHYKKKRKKRQSEDRIGM